MIKRIPFLAAIAVAFFALFIMTARAQSVDNPVQMLQKTVNKLQSDISGSHASLVKSPHKLYELVKKTLIPAIAIDRMAAMTLGPKWRSADKAQRQAFVSAFSQMLTRTYSRSLLQVSNYDIKIFPLRGNGYKTAEQVAVHGKLSPKNGSNSSSVTYYLERAGSHWKIYDFAVEGVSFVKNFQAQFQQYPSLSELLTKLNALNARQGKV